MSVAGSCFPKGLQWSACVLLLAVAYALMNERLLAESVLYRAAAADTTSAIRALVGFAFNGLAFACAMVALPRRWFIGALAFIAASALINIGYGRIVGEAVDQSKIAWMLTEAAQAGNAAGAFFTPTVIAIATTVLCVALMGLARRFAPIVPMKKGLIVGLTGLILPLFILDPIRLAPIPAERNAWVYLVKIMTAPPPPERAAVLETPKAPPVETIIWLVDESINHDAYVSEVKSSTLRHEPIDFGEAMSLGNCSAPANVAMRSGVNVRAANRKMDLRATPSIWTYAKKAGFQTVLIDGQTTGATQNLILDPERRLIDTYIPAKLGVDTDRQIAKMLNDMTRKGRLQFIYVVLSGAHFQYRDHYPAGYIPADSPIETQYKAAVRYSKTGFFDTLFAGLNRETTAVFYTSDHGQNVQGAQVPHCNPTPHRQEFSIPLLAFVPQVSATAYKNNEPGTRSQSQIFPTTLSFMGYDPQVGSKYDNDLSRPTARKIWFGRNVVPVEPGAEIEIQDNPQF
jgi:glucan phosphoethanolaminetransferase (alkaline phosphatase superfamily)